MLHPPTARTAPNCWRPGSPANPGYRAGVGGDGSQGRRRGQPSNTVPEAAMPAVPVCCELCAEPNCKRTVVLCQPPREDMVDRNEGDDACDDACGPGQLSQHLEPALLPSTCHTVISVSGSTIAAGMMVVRGCARDLRVGPSGLCSRRRRCRQDAKRSQQQAINGLSQELHLERLRSIRARYAAIDGTICEATLILASARTSPRASARCMSRRLAFTHGSTITYAENIEA